jgi:nitrogen fixation/metabolism regulation signal transduction histidine kinase
VTRKLSNGGVFYCVFQIAPIFNPAFQNIEFTFEGPKSPIFVMLNPTLHSWTIENLVKNAIDAMKGRKTSFKK